MGASSAADTLAWSRRSPARGSHGLPPLPRCQPVRLPPRLAGAGGQRLREVGSAGVCRRDGRALVAGEAGGALEVETGFFFGARRGGVGAASEPGDRQVLGSAAALRGAPGRSRLGEPLA